MRLGGGLGGGALDIAELDLPYGGGGGREDEDEEVPGILVYYGEVYESSAVVFVLDRSWSMTLRGRWAVQRDETCRAVRELDPAAEVGLVYYNDDLEVFGRRPRRAEAAVREELIGFVSRHEPLGGTCLGEGLLEALRIAGRSTRQERAIILTSDGRTGTCDSTPVDRDDLIRRSLAANPDRSIRVHTLWIDASGDAEDGAFLRRLAEAHGGTFRRVGGP